MSTLHKGRGYIYTIQYHIVWCVKYRKAILVEQVEQDFKLILRRIAEDNDIVLSELETDKDHVHLLIDCKPQHYIPDMLKALKGVSARLLLKKHPHLKSQLWGGHLWNPSYFIATVSENTEEQIRQYIQHQQKK